jgi:hypothetical protein
MKQNSDVDMKFSLFENVAVLEELAVLVEVPISALQHMSHAIPMLLADIAQCGTISRNLIGSHRKQVQSQLSPSKMKECEDIGF